MFLTQSKTDELIRENLRRCTENILGNYNIPGDITFTEFFTPCNTPNAYIAFLNWSAAAHFSVDKHEVLKQLLSTGVVSKKSYRQLRALVRQRMKDAAWNLKHLAEETLRNLGV